MLITTVQYFGGSLGLAALVGVMGDAATGAHAHSGILMLAAVALAGVVLVVPSKGEAVPPVPPSNRPAPGVPEEDGMDEISVGDGHEESRLEKDALGRVVGLSARYAGIGWVPPSLEGLHHLRVVDLS
ncbi:hypothetical protein [Streptomyces pseudovenezuelae]|uniref:hypothetical protein n=1 Tax=Streptomyces pseudovenezuelae TaxID=67350 RepID=UPI0036E015B7